MRTKYLILAICVMAACVSCSKQYDDRIAALKERSEALHKADKETKDMLIGEMNRLSDDIDNLLFQMEDRVLDRLDKMIQGVEDKILEQNVLVNKSIKEQSDKLDRDIYQWRSDLDKMVEDNTLKLENSRQTLEKSLQKAISEGNSTLVSRIRAGLKNLDALKGGLGTYVKKVQARVDALEDLEKLTTDTKKAVDDLKWRREDMLVALDEYEDRMSAIIESELEKNANSNLCDAVDYMISLYESARDIYEESAGYLDDIDSYFSSLPDIEGLLSETQAILDNCSEVESMLDDMDNGTVDDVLATLSDAIEHASEGDVSIADVESAYDEVLKNSHDFLDDTNDIMDTFDNVIGILEDEIGNVEALISDVEGKF